MAGFRVAIQPGGYGDNGGKTVYIAPTDAPAMFTHDRFAARRFRDRDGAQREADRFNESALALSVVTPSPAYPEEFD